MRITIVGTGYVGLTTGVCLASKKHEITCLDIDKEKILKLQNGEEIIYEPNLKNLLKEGIKNKKLSFTSDYKKTYNSSKVIMLCAPTPEGEDGRVDMKYVDIAIEQIINNIKNDCFIIIKSTVSVGTCDKILEKTKKCKYKINLIFNPEFLSQGEAIDNFLNPQRIVIGVNNKESRNLMEEIYADFNCPKLFMDLKSAEISKYACNNFLAIKLAYINEIANLCERLEINIENVLKVMKSDKRIGEFYLNPGIGYGGSCLPKDTKALAMLAKENNIELHMVEATINSNNKQRNKLLEKLDKYYDKKDDLNVAILGLSFKANTNDIRESQTIETIQKLQGNVKRIVCYDNKKSTIESCKKLFETEKNIFFTDDIKETLKDSDVCMIFNQEEEILRLSPNTFTEYMKEPIILDGKNCFNVVDMKNENIKYDSIGRNINEKYINDYN